MQTQNKWVIQCDNRVTECAPEHFAETFQQLMGDLGSQGRMMESLVLNGIVQEPDQPVQIDAEQGGEIVIRTNQVDAVEPSAAADAVQAGEVKLEDVLETAHEYLPTLRHGLTQVARYFQAGQEHEGSELLGEALEGMIWVGTCVGGLSGYGTSEWHQQMAEAHDAYQAQLSSFFSALERMDFTEMADLLEYELAETIVRMEAAVAEKWPLEKGRF